jgi:zinc D-Ala-D-Ala dipeptidase
MTRTARILLIALAFACTTAVQLPRNQYGLEVVPDEATYLRLVESAAEKKLVDLSTLGIATDIRYATENNFMKRKLYPVAEAWLRAPAAAALVNVQKELAEKGLAIKVFDAYRPYRVTEAMWEPIKNPDYVADPSKGSRHNRGAAVDLTLIDLATGAEIEMPTPYDDFTPRAHHDFNDLSAGALRNRALLRDVMTRNGFDALPSEWWHYDFRNWKTFELMNVALEDL